MSKKLILVIVATVMLGSFSMLMRRSGEAYNCNIPSYPRPYYRDVRGFPLVFLQRSVDFSACPRIAAPEDYGAHHLNLINLAADAAFWAAVLGGAVILVTKKPKKVKK